MGSCFVEGLSAGRGTGGYRGGGGNTLGECRERFDIKVTSGVISFKGADGKLPLVVPSRSQDDVSTCGFSLKLRTDVILSVDEKSGVRLPD